MKKLIAKGVDISTHNVINWSKVRKSEIDFVIIRAGYGNSTIDKKFEENIESAIKCGLDIGIYWFSYAASVSDAIQEAKFCLKTISRYRKYINYPVFFDWEDDSCRYVREERKVNPTSTLVSNMATAFVDTIRMGNFQAGIYSNPNYLNLYFNNEIKENYDIWLAHVRDAKGHPLLQSNYKGKYTMHQYSWVGKFSGFVGNVDTNYCYKEYVKKEQIPSTYQIPEDITFTTDVNKNVVSTYSYKSHAQDKVSDHFKVREFACTKYSNKVKIHNKLIIILEALYKKLNCSKIIVTSGYRTKEADIAVGGDGKGYHTMGRAADIICYGQNKKPIPAAEVCCALEDMGGIYGIGYISPTAVHVDTRLEENKWWGDETKGGRSIQQIGCDTFHDYFGI